ncbi:S8 family peptidase [Lacunimicrobium album]
MTDYRHFSLVGTRTSQAYTSPPAGGEQESPPRPEHVTHGDKLLQDLDRAVRIAKTRQKVDPTRDGLQFIPMVFSEGSDLALKLQSLTGNESRGIRVLSVREKGDSNEYLIAVPDCKVDSLAQKFHEYRHETTETGRPKNEDFASSVTGIEAGDLSDYWREPDEQLPAKEKAFWWEVWLTSFPGDGADSWFRTTAAAQRITLSQQQTRFPDRLVVLAYASREQWEKFPGLLQHLAEFRRAKIVSGEFTRLPPSGQAEFIQDLLARTTFAHNKSVRVCILDTGVNRGHPLLESAISSEDLQTWQKEWGSEDHHGHGTELAGLCLFGCLTSPLYDGESIELTHRLESVKILPPDGQNQPPDYGPITTGAMALAEAALPEIQRIFCLAVTCEGNDQWRPTLWSASIDQACAGTLDGYRRLLICSTGNLREDIGKNYPHENHLSSVEDPAQAWNALTVGAYTNLAWLEEQGLEGYSPIAKPGSLSPASRTSLCWNENWPYKPDIVFEGGNYASDASGFTTGAEDLALLTTMSRPETAELLGTSRDSSAATALAARMAAILQAEYPSYWPESIRGLMVHSAEWTPRMMEEFPYPQRRQRLRVYGMGVPNLLRARRSAQGWSTMVIQDELQPYKKTTGDNSTHEMHLHQLPLPKEVLEELGSTRIRMRVTLSYFIEPNPPRRGYIARHQYASHGLRFSVRRPEESLVRMMARLTSADWPTENGRKKKPFDTISDDREWDLGPERVSVRGSIHSDAWQGTAAQLAASNQIAVFPVGGWWRYRKDATLVEKLARYSLIVSISSEDTTVDLHQAIETQIRSQTAVEAGITLP